MQLMTANDTATTEEAYLEVDQGQDRGAVRRGEPRSAPCIAEPPDDEEEALERFGRNLGIAFQLVDDMLDFSARQASSARAVGDDFRDGKITLPIVIAFARGDAEERAFWRRTLEDGEQREGDLERAIAPARPPRRARRDPRPRPRLRRARPIDALAVFPGRPAAPGADRGRRVRDRAAAFEPPRTPAICSDRGCAGTLGAIDRARSAECSSAW